MRLCGSGQLGRALGTQWGHSLENVDEGSEHSEKNVYTE